MLGTSATLGNFDDSTDDFVMTSKDSDPMQKVVRALKGIKKTKSNAVGNKSMALITSPHSFNIQPPQEA